MSFIRTIFRTFDNLSDHMVGQDVERHSLVPGRRAGGSYAALANKHIGREGGNTFGMIR